MRIATIIVVFLAFFGIGIHPLTTAEQDHEIDAEQIIDSYMQANGIEIKPGTEEYGMFMRQIFWGEHPELAEAGSNFIKNQEELEYVRAYAWKYSGYEELYGGKNEPDVGEAPSPPAGYFSQLLIDTSTSNFIGRSNAIAYAYLWSTSGGASRNPEYPDFELDCTNFASQAMRAGGFWLKGSGDGCKYEDTSTEWYVFPNPSPPLWCLGDNRDWEWSYSWSLPWEFRDYFAYQNDYATIPGWTTSVSTAKYHLDPGDIVQLQYDSGGGNWETYHTMIVTDEDANDLYVTYHTNNVGLDEVDKPLSSINLGADRFMLVKIKFPKLLFLPISLMGGGIMGYSTQPASLDSYPSPLEFSISTPFVPVSPYPEP